MTGFVGFFRVQYKRKIVDNKIRGKILRSLFSVGLLWGDYLDKSLLASFSEMTTPLFDKTSFFLL